MIRIRQAEYEDIPRIMKFIDEHWKKDHILARDRNFFEWQFVDRGKVNIYIAIENEKIYAIDTYILYNDMDVPDMTGSIWKAIPCEEPMIGIKLNEVMEQSVHPRYCVGFGYSSRTIKFHKLLGHDVIKMDHFYRLNDLSEYYIATVKEKQIGLSNMQQYALKKINSFEQFKNVIPDEILRKQVFYKDYHYIFKRYFCHPVWEYDKWEVVCEDRNKAVVITRTVEYEGKKCIKLVDYFGSLDKISCLSSAFDKMMVENGCEYIDIYSYGIPKEYLLRGGFTELTETSLNIIPNYFQPFVRKNIDLWMMKVDIDGFFLLRGDGDQDRPS